MKSKGGPPALAKYREGWGGWVETRERGGREEVRLKAPLALEAWRMGAVTWIDELRRRVDTALMEALRELRDDDEADDARDEEHHAARRRHRRAC